MPPTHEEYAMAKAGKPPPPEDGKTAFYRANPKKSILLRNLFQKSRDFFGFALSTLTFATS